MNNFLFDKPENRLEILMQKNNYTLKKVSDDTDIPITTLSGYKKNLRTPKKENAEILAEYFGVSIPYLLGLDDNPVLVNPGSAKEIFKGFAKVLQGKSTIENKITEWTPFGKDLAIILAELNQSEALSDYIDFLASKKGFNPVLVKAIKEFIADEKQGLIPFLINKSGAEDSPYHYVWEAWVETPEYKRRQEEKKRKK
ncbi:helix-turn-helix domain-containing protein [Streptococcus mitis]|jgi:DNA-binding protein|uniref:helix-turn-helix domain-containing protein n=1 Tax=Streptococcus mitis TaxID=28037 RepID=UPI0021B731BB|nr:helix-turn-helix transcriptional regulator [Streptococcus mitis]